MGLVVGSLVASVGSAFAGHHCHKCPKCCCCNGSPAAAPAAAPAAVPQANAAANSVFPQAQLVQSMPVFQTPLMFASMPVMPAMAYSTPNNQPAAAPAAPREIRDCCDRVDKLEEQMKKLAESVNNMQTLIQGQNEILKVLVKERPSALPPPAMQEEIMPPPMGRGR
jgi:hypothetical protein